MAFEDSCYGVVFLYSPLLRVISEFAACHWLSATCKSVFHAYRLVASQKLTTLGTIHFIVNKAWRMRFIARVGFDQSKLWLQANFKKSEKIGNFMEKSGYEYLPMDAGSVKLIKDVGNITLYLRGHSNYWFFINETHEWKNLVELSICIGNGCGFPLVDKAPNLKRLKFFWLKNLDLRCINGLKNLEYLELECNTQMQPVTVPLDVPKLAHVAVYKFPGRLTLLGIFSSVLFVEIKSEASHVDQHELSSVFPNMKKLAVYCSVEISTVATDFSALEEITCRTICIIPEYSRHNIKRATLLWSLTGPINGFTNLETLVVQSPNSDFLTNQSASLDSVRVLHLEGPTTDEVFNKIAHWPSLKTLTITSPQSPDAVLEALQTSKSLTTVTLRKSLTRASDDIVRNSEFRVVYI